MIKNDWDKKLRRAATGSKEQVSQLGQDLIDMNYDDWTEGESYESLVKRYQGKGQKAMDDTIGQVAARTGGLASSYAAQAGQQAYGGWMENLENAARSLYDTERQELMDRYNIANDIYQQGVNEQRYIEERDYQRGRDAISDTWRQIEWDYMTEKDKKEENKKAIEDLETEMYNLAYSGNGSWPQFKERTTALGLTKDDYERVVHDANDAYDEANRVASDKAAAEAYKTRVSYFEEYVNRLIKDTDNTNNTDDTIAEGIKKYIKQNYYVNGGIPEEKIDEVNALLDIAKRMGVDVDNIW